MEGLFNDADDYFQNKMVNVKQLKSQRNYSGVKSRINTNLPNKVLGVDQKKFRSEVRQIMDQNEYRDRHEETIPVNIPD